MSKRTELFTMLCVCQKCLYGAESWVLSSKRMEKRFNTLIMNLFKRLACIRIDTRYTDDDILAIVQLPSPCDLLRRARLRYFCHADYILVLPDLWALLARDADWIQLLENDMVWMWQQLQHASSLPDPREHYEQWLYIIQTSPGYWKRLIRRACLHSVLQRQRAQQVCELHRRVLPRLWSLVQREEMPHAAAETSEAEVFGCMLCKKTCRNAAGEAAHMCKTHGVVSKLRFLYDHPTCGRVSSTSTPWRSSRRICTTTGPTGPCCRVGIIAAHRLLAPAHNVIVKEQLNMTACFRHCRGMDLLSAQSVPGRSWTLMVTGISSWWIRYVTRTPSWHFPMVFVRVWRHMLFHGLC